MKIACVATGWYPQSPGGLEKYVFGMTHELTRAGDAVDLFVTGTPESWNERAAVFSIADPAASLPARALAARRCFARNYREPYDVLNLHFAMNALPLVPFVSRRTPRVFHFHGPWAAESLAEGGGRLSVAIKAWLERYVYRRMDRFITLSTSFKALLVRDYGIDAERVTVVPMGIDTGFFTPAVDRTTVRDALGWPADRFVLFTARRLIARVGVLELIEAIARVPDAAARVSVKIAGKGPLEPEIRRAIEAHGLHDCIELLGFVSESDLVRAYQAADLTVLPTQSLEGFGTIISESLACGTPVAVTPIGGMPEALGPFSPQLIAASATPADIAALVDGIVAGRIAVPSRDASRAYAVEQYSWPRVYAQVRAVFEGTIAERRRS